MSAGAAAFVALGIAIPVGLHTTGADGTPPTSTAPVPPPTAAPSPATAAPATVPVPPQAQPPAGLSAQEQALWSSLRMVGVESNTCASYPPGESDVPGVVAAISCTLDDGSFSQPIWYRKFADASSMDGYMTLRANEITTAQGDCSAGQELNGEWNNGGAALGRMVCVYEPANGVNYFKIAWTSNASDTVAIIKDGRAAAAASWWHAYGGDQFGGS